MLKTNFLISLVLILLNKQLLLSFLPNRTSSYTHALQIHYLGLSNPILGPVQIKFSPYINILHFLQPFSFPLPFHIPKPSILISLFFFTCIFFYFVFSYYYPLSINLSFTLPFYAQFSLTKKLFLSQFLVDF